MKDKREAVTGCVEKKTFAPDKKKKSLWKKFKDWWNAKIDEDECSCSPSPSAPSPSPFCDCENEEACNCYSAACMGSNVTI